MTVNRLTPSPCDKTQEGLLPIIRLDRSKREIASVSQAARQ
jgi:hypothetical protein